MSEPITLYRGEEVTTVYAPSEAQRLLMEGWQPTPFVTEVIVPARVLPDEDEPDLTVGGEYSSNPGAPLEAIPSVTRKAGRPKKVQ